MGFCLSGKPQSINKTLCSTLLNYIDECFVLELIIDNLSNEPRKVRELLKEVKNKLAERKVSSPWMKGARDRRADIEDGFGQDKPPGYNKMMEDQLTTPLATKTAPPPLYKLS